MAFYIYILSDEKNSKFIVGFTNSLAKTVHETKHSQSGIFASQQITKLVYYEAHKEFDIAKRRERELIMWDDDYMKTIISLQNGKLEDLYNKIF